jgi:hypothetical protein
MATTTASPTIEARQLFAPNGPCGAPTICTNMLQCCTIAGSGGPANGALFVGSYTKHPVYLKNQRTKPNKVDDLQGLCINGVLAATDTPCIFWSN